MNLTAIQVQTLRKLATEYMSYATLPVQREKMELWKALNRSKMERPMVVVEQLPWRELEHATNELTCVCTSGVWLEIERTLRRELLKWRHFPVDMILAPFIKIPKIITDSSFGIDVQADTKRSDSNSATTSHDYHNQFEEMEDLEKIKDSVITYDKEGSDLLMQEAHYVFDGYAPIRQSGGLAFHLGVWDKLSMYMNVQNAYIEMIDRPELIHGAMQRLTDSTIAAIDQCNELKCVDTLANECHFQYIYTDDLLPDFDACKESISQNTWALGMAQLMSSCSPETFIEFELPYITKMAEKFGHIYYGCCEMLHDRLEHIKKIPNLRKVSCSPWSNKEIFAQNIGTELVMSNKPNPAYIAQINPDFDVVKKDLQETVDIAKVNNVNLEMILKDVSTVKSDIRHLEEWGKIAMKIVENY